MGTIAFLGTPEIVIILVVALIVFGPQKLPEVGRQIGSAMRELRKVSGEVQRALEIDDFGTGSAFTGYDAGRWNGSAPAPLHAVAPIAGAIATGDIHDDLAARHAADMAAAEVEIAHSMTAADAVNDETGTAASTAHGAGLETAHAPAVHADSAEMVKTATPEAVTAH